HVSNFRPVKRVTAVIEIFRRIRAEVPAQLLMVGDGPDMSEAVGLCRKYELSGAVRLLGDQEQVVPLLPAAGLFLRPPAQEIFGLAAVEGMACEVPVVAARVGGVPELVEDGATGFLRAPEDLTGMASAAVRLLTDGHLHRQVASAARTRAVECFADTKIIPMYEAYYDEVLGGAGGAG